MGDSIDYTVNIFHEKQSRFFCGVHAINNLLQMKAVSKETMDKICDELSPGTYLNPHRDIFGWGNYDVNVLTVALQQHGYDAIWHDRRKSIRDYNLRWENILGFILNSPTERFSSLLWPFKGAHWYALRALNFKDRREYFNLDSKLKVFTSVGKTDEEFCDYLDNLIAEKPKTQVLFVVSNEVRDFGSWKI